MLFFIIGLSIGLTIFTVTSAVVIIRRRQKAKQNVGYIINDNGTRVVAPVGIPQTHYQRPGLPVTHYSQPGVPITHYTPEGVPVIHYPPPSYQPPPFYPHSTSSQVTVQLTATPSAVTSNPSTQQRVINNENAPVSDASILPSTDEKRPMQQAHEGAVETVSHI
ncbi:hypothetical protein ACLKA7_014542 [Drosophila subpalustris]